MPLKIDPLRSLVLLCRCSVDITKQESIKDLIKTRECDLILI